MWDKPDLSYNLPTKFLSCIPKWIKNVDPNLFLSSNFLVLDFETTTIDFGNPHLEENQMVLAGWFYKGLYKECYGTEFEQQELVNDVESCDFIVAHNAKFELGWLRRLGIDVANLAVWCTQVGEYVLRGNLSNIGLSLEVTATRRKLPFNKIKVIEKLWSLGIQTFDIPRTLLSPYCRRDVFLALAIFLEQRRSIVAKDLLRVMYVRCWLPVVLMDIESRGMQLDEDRVKKVYNKVQGEFNELYSKVVKFTDGVDVDSPKQLRVYLYETLKISPPMKYGRVIQTPKAAQLREVPTPANYSTDADALKLLKPRTKKQKEFVKLLLEYKTRNGELTKYLAKFLDCCENADGILTGNINQTVTKTHRTSSSGRNYACQFQNFKRAFKPLFKAKKSKWRFVERDQAQLEFRAGVQLGQDEQGYSDIINGIDLHAQTASQLFREFDNLNGVKRSEIRTKAKADTFKPLFGGTSGTPEQQRYYEFFRKHYHQITETQEEWIKECLRKKQFRNPPNGLIFYFPYVKINPQTGYVHENEKIRNIPIQSTATADVVLIGLVLMWHCLQGLGTESFIVNTVHDSIETEEPEEEAELIEEIGRWAMLDGVYWIFDKVYNYQWQVPLDIETESNTHWSNTPEWENKWLS